MKSIQSISPRGILPRQRLGRLALVMALVGCGSASDEKTGVVQDKPSPPRAPDTSPEGAADSDTQAPTDAGAIADAPPASGDAGKSVDGNSPSADDASTREPMRVEDTPHCDPGTRRPARPTEGAEYCICPVETELWTCYGPDPTLSGDTSTSCAAAFTQGSDANGCIQSYSDCADNRNYSISCTRGFCYCVIDAEPVAELEPGTVCPVAMRDANDICGWDLREE
jgi:hypothetical protein